MVIQKELRILIHPELEVMNVDGTPENKLPVIVIKKRKMDELLKLKTSLKEYYV